MPPKTPNPQSSRTTNAQTNDERETPATRTQSSSTKDDPLTIPQRLAATIAAVNARKQLTDPEGLKAQKKQTAEDLDRILHPTNMPEIPADPQSITDLLENRPVTLGRIDVTRIPETLATVIAATELHKLVQADRERQDYDRRQGASQRNIQVPTTPPTQSRDEDVVEPMRKRDHLRNGAKKVVGILKFRKSDKTDGSENRKPDAPSPSKD